MMGLRGCTHQARVDGVSHQQGALWRMMQGVTHGASCLGRDEILLVTITIINRQGVVCVCLHCMHIGQA